MTNFPTQIDTDVSLPRVDDNLSDIGALAINALREALFAVEREMGLGGSGTVGSVAARLAVSINPDGTLIPSAIAAAGAITGPIHNSDVASNAAVAESKIALTYSTQTLYNLIQTAQTDVNAALLLVSSNGVDFVRHISGATPLLSGQNGRHVVSHIDINSEPSDTRDANFTWPSGKSPRNVAGTLRPSNLALFLRDINTDLVDHLRANGTVQDGYADRYSHPAASVTVDPSTFLIIPPTVTDVQKFAAFVDQTNFTAVSNHQQNMHTNGISLTCRGAILSTDGYGQNVIPYTAVSTFLNHGSGTDDNSTGDDIIQFTPAVDATFGFDSKFSSVKAGDVVTVNYGTVQTQYLIDSVRFSYDSFSPPNRTYFVRINGRNLRESTTVTARIDRPIFQDDAKFGTLATSAVNNTFGKNGSLLVSNPKGASALSIGFNPSAFDSNHYNLYLQLYVTGDPAVKQFTLPPIDVTGNLGATPGLYTLDSIIAATNAAFTSSGFNYRFQAFGYKGEFGIMLADSINNVSFSIISGNSIGGSVSTTSFAQNVVDITNGIDPLGFGPNGSAVASPQYTASYPSIQDSLNVTKVFSPLIHKNYYVNGIERNFLRQPSDGYADTLGNFYWKATITSKTIQPPTNVKATYLVHQDLTTWDLRPGKTIVVQPDFLYSDSRYLETDYGRFIIDSISYDLCGCGELTTTIEVYSAIHGVGTPIAISSTNIPVRIYASDDSVAIDQLNILNATSSDQFKRWFETYIDQHGRTLTHERARFDLTTANTQFAKFDIINVSSKLRGYGGQIDIVLTCDVAGNYSGYLQKPGGTHLGPVSSGKIGTPTRLYDESGVDFIEVYLDPATTISAITGIATTLDLFTSLQKDQELFYISSFQFNTTTKQISRVVDRRQFGNVSEKEFTNSAQDYIAGSSRFTEPNGIVRGFDYISTTGNTLQFNGGTALVAGKLVSVNNFSTTLPIVQDYNGGSPVSGVLFAICCDQQGEIKLMPLTDADSAVNNIVNPGRTLQLYSLDSTQFYTVESETFSHISTQRKDLVIFATAWIKATTVSSFTTSVSDARRVVQDQAGAANLTWTSDTGVGNFSSIAALNTWLQYNSSYSNTVKVRGNFTVTTPVVLNYNSLVKFIGDGAVFTIPQTTGLNRSVAITIGSNVSLEGIKFINKYNPITAGDGTYSTSVLNNYQKGVITLSATSTANVQNVTIKNCDFVSTTTDRYPFITATINSTVAAIQNLSIEQNRFSSTTGFDDIRSIISILGSHQNGAVANATAAPKLVQCRIQDNVCDKNQMIIISSLRPNSESTPSNGLSAENVSVQRNVCGTIFYLTRGDRFTNVFNPDGIVRDKLSNIIVKNNSCKIIGQAYDDGLYRTTFTYGVSFGSSTVEGNQLHWFLGAFGSSDSSTVEKRHSLLMRGNNFEAYNTTYLAQFATSAVPNTAVQIYGVASGNDQAIMDGNHFGTGASVAADRATTTDYGYDSLISFSTSSIITNNFFSGLNASGKFIIAGAKAQVTQNRFDRGSTTIAAYIDCAANDLTIKHNYFDQPTVDGTSTALVLNKSYGTLYSDNKNQTEVVILTMDAGFGQLNDSSNYNEYTLSTAGSPLTSATLNNDPYNFAFSSGNWNSLLSFQDNFTAATRSIRYKMPISNFVPNGARILTVKMGIYSFGTNAPDPASAIYIDVTRTVNGAAQLDAKTLQGGPNLELDTSNIYNQIEAKYPPSGPLSGANWTNLHTATQFVSLDLTNYLSFGDVSQYFVCNKDYPIFVSLLLNWKTQIGQTNLYFSPIQITYRM